MHVHLLADEPRKVQRIRGLLEPQHYVDAVILGEDEVHSASRDVVMVDADLRRPDRVEQIRRNMSALSDVRERLFIIEKNMHAQVVQAQVLGATGFLSGPHEIVAKIDEIHIARQTAAQRPSPTVACIADSARAFSSLFAAVQTGGPVDVADAENATHHVMSGITRSGLSTWLDDVRRHHEGTFQHCLLVTGISVGFALHLRFSERDVKRLGLAATLHDVGKARIPLAILDKPGKLDPQEEATMRLHPVFGYDALKKRNTISPEVLDAVRHHHEFLDGTGYPDGLTAKSIPDIVRLLTISDIFAALIEARSYRPPMPRPRAYDILSEMEGKLEPALVRAFGHVALKA